ncbi:ABC transporter ATP-binding protein, partial [Oxalicibacterium faecigallinarum]|uniref:ABC transporter ATP-binding protein n=1 Tax=Oxalicibacterium faecigallinarum TaxID=573741 RepID=UPI00280A5DF4
MHLSIFKPYLQRYRASLVIAMLLMITEVSVELCSPLILAHLIDAGIIPRDMHAIFLWGGILLGLAFLSFVCGIANTFFAADAAQGVVHDLRSDMFRRLIACSITQRNQFATGSIVTRMTGDMTQIHNAIFLLLRIYLRAPFLIIGCTVLALIVDFWLGMMLVIATPLSITLLLYVIRLSAARFGEVQKRVDHINRLLSENIIGMRMIRSFDRGRHEAQRFEVANQELRREATRALRLPEVSMPMLLFLMNLSVLSIIWFGENRIVQGSLQVGAVLALLNYAIRVSAAYGFIGMIVSNLTMAYAATRRTAEILALPASEVIAQPVTKDSTPDASGIHFHRVSYRYPNTAQYVLEDVSFQTEDARLIAVVGLTGAGKSTLLRIIAGLIKPERGQVFLHPTKKDATPSRPTTA